MAKMIKLILISSDNHNKYYDMIDTEDGSFRIEYGRVGVTKQVGSYPISKWDSTYNSKVRKGYKDITELYVEEKVDSVDFQEISDFNVKHLIAKLQAYARKEVATFYNITADKVTKKQVDEAQSILNALSGVGHDKVDEVNKLLLDLFAVIPRKMKNVSSHLFSVSEPNVLARMISREQDLLDTMASQVKQVELVKENMDDSLTILDAMGLDIFGTDDKEIDFIKGKMADLSPKFVSAFRVVNRKTQKKFDDYVNSAENKRCETFFHGSRNENWLSILETGLVLRPTNAVISGKMFGYGTYFADKALKSYGYTSGRGSYWVRGNSNEAFMSLFDVHLGNSCHIKRHESWCNSLNEASLKQRGKYDSLFAEGGVDLRNNEYIVYNQAQSTVKFLIQLKG